MQARKLALTATGTLRCLKKTNCQKAIAPEELAASQVSAIIQQQGFSELAIAGIVGLLAGRDESDRYGPGSF